MIVSNFSYYLLVKEAKNFLKQLCFGIMVNKLCIFLEILKMCIILIFGIKTAQQRYWILLP